MSFFGSHACFKYIRDGLYISKSKSGIDPKKIWSMFVDMHHIIATCYNKVVVELLKHQNKVSKSFIPI